MDVRPHAGGGDVVGGAELALPGPGEHGPFSLSDAAQSCALLGAAGLVDVSAEAVAGARVVHGASVDDDVRALLEIGPLGEAYQAAADDARQAAVAAVIDAVEPRAFRSGLRSSMLRPALRAVLRIRSLRRAARATATPIGAASYRDGDGWRLPGSAHVITGRRSES